MRVQLSITKETVFLSPISVCRTVCHIIMLYSMRQKPEEADSMNRFFNNWDKKEYRNVKVQMEKETSYEKLVEEGFNAAQTGTNPEEIVAYRTVIRALNKGTGRAYGGETPLLQNGSP